MPQYNPFEDEEERQRQIEEAITGPRSEDPFSRPPIFEPAMAAALRGQLVPGEGLPDPDRKPPQMTPIESADLLPHIKSAEKFRELLEKKQALESPSDNNRIPAEPISKPESSDEVSRAAEDWGKALSKYDKPDELSAQDNTEVSPEQDLEEEVEDADDLASAEINRLPVREEKEAEDLLEEYESESGDRDFTEEIDKEADTMLEEEAPEGIAAALEDAETPEAIAIAKETETKDSPLLTEDQAKAAKLKELISRAKAGDATPKEEAVIASELQQILDARKARQRELAIAEGMTDIVRGVARYHGGESADRSAAFNRMRQEADVPLTQYEAAQKLKAVELKEQQKRQFELDKLQQILAERAAGREQRQQTADVKTGLIARDIESKEKYRQDMIAAKKIQQEQQAKHEERRLTEQDARRKKEERQYRQQQINTARGLLKDDPRFKKAVEQGMEFESVNELIEQASTGNQAAVAALGTKLARAMGEVGVLTDTDVVRYVNGTSWGRKLKEWFVKGAEGEFSKDMIKDISENISVLKKKLSGDVDRVYGNASRRMQVAYPDLDETTIRGLLGNPMITGEAPVEQKKPPKEGEIKEWKGKKYKLIGNKWVEQ